jgi:hypothetical protein
MLAFFFKLLCFVFWHPLNGKIILQETKEQRTEKIDVNRFSDLNKKHT